MRDNHTYIRVQIVVQTWCRWVQMGCRKNGLFSICTLFYPFHDLDLSLRVQGCSEKDWYQTRFLVVLAAAIKGLSPSFLVPQYVKSNLSLVFSFFFRLSVKVELAWLWRSCCAGFRLAEVLRGRENSRKVAELQPELRVVLLPKAVQTVIKDNRINRLSPYQVSGDCGFWRDTPLEKLVLGCVAPPLLLFIYCRGIRRVFQGWRDKGCLQFQVFATLKEGGGGGNAMIYTDGVHLVSDSSLEDLHTFARSIGLRREWFQCINPNHPHYDLTTARKSVHAIRAGAKKVTSVELLKKLGELC